MLIDAHLMRDLAVLALITLSIVITLRALSMTGDRRRRITITEEMRTGSRRRERPNDDR